MSASISRVVLNEWIFHDLAGENGPISQRSSAELLIALISRKVCLCFLEASPWSEKAHSLMKSEDTLVRKLSKVLHTRVLLDQEKCLRVKRRELTQEEQRIVDRAPRKDQYLIETYLIADANLLVTSDHGLLAAFANDERVIVAPRTDYIWGVTRVSLQSQSTTESAQE